MSCFDVDDELIFGLMDGRKKGHIFIVTCILAGYALAYSNLH